MKPGAAFKTLPFALFASVLFAAGIACGQQQSATPGAGAYSSPDGAASSAGDSDESGMYPSSTTAREEQSAAGPANQQSSSTSSAKSANPAGTLTSRSPWHTAAFAAKESSVSWTAGASTFGGQGASSQGASSWIAGRSSFALAPQPAGIWQLTLSGVSQPSVAASPASPSQGLSPLPPGLSAKAAAIISSAHLPPHKGFSLNLGGFSAPAFGAKSSSGGANSNSTLQGSNLDSFESPNGSTSKSKKATPTSGLQTLPDLNGKVDSSGSEP